jgi:uncharacterized protein YfeS
MKKALLILAVAFTLTATAQGTKSVDEELKKIAINYTTQDHKINLNPFEDWTDEQIDKELERLEKD